MSTRSAALVMTTLAVLGAGCVAGDPTPASDDTTAEAGPSDAQEAALPYVGLDEQAALELAADNGDDARVGTAADVGEPGQTDDYVVGRLTFVVVEGVVTEVIVETEAGPVTVAAF